MVPSGSLSVPRAPAPSGPAGMPEAVDVRPPEQARLLGLARAALAAASGAIPEAELGRTLARGPRPAWPAAAFVTLLEDGRLRGCMGSLDASVPVWRSVVDAASWAARADPRFRSVAPEELAGIEVEVSVLGPLVRLLDPGALRLGTDGVVVAASGRRGLLLPEVATAAGFDRTALLDACCEKAGLRRGAWRDPATRLFVFRTRRFGGPALEP